MDKPVRLGRVLWIGGACSLALIYLLLWLRVTTNPIEYTGSDFITYYSVGVIAGRYGLQDAYDLGLQLQVKADVVGFELSDEKFMPHNHIPWLNPLLGLLVYLTGEDYLLGMTVWALFLSLVYLYSIVRLLRLPAGASPPWSLVTAFFLFFPVFVSLVNGQDTVFVFLGLVLFTRGLVRGEYWLAAFGLGLVTLRPQMVIMLGLPVLLARPAIGWRFVLVAAGFVLASILPLGLPGVLDFIHLFTDVIVASKDHAMFNLVGLFTRAFPALGAGMIQWIGWLAYAAGCLGLCLAWLRKMRTQVSLPVLGVSVIALVFLSPHLVYHDLALLLLPLAFVLWQEQERGVLARSVSQTLVVSLSLLLVLASFSVELQFLAVYLLMGILLVPLLWPAWGDHFFTLWKGTSPA
jgi:hypothetical protein